MWINTSQVATKAFQRTLTHIVWHLCRRSRAWGGFPQLFHCCQCHRCSMHFRFFGGRFCSMFGGLCIAIARGVPDQMAVILPLASRAPMGWRLALECSNFMAPPGSLPPDLSPDHDRSFVGSHPAQSGECLPACTQCVCGCGWQVMRGVGMAASSAI